MRPRRTGSLLAGVFGVGLVIRHGLAARHATVPLAPFLAVGAAAVLLVS